MSAEVPKFFEDNLEDMVNDIRQLVECESPSNDPVSLRECSDLIEGIMNERLSVKAEKIEVPGKSPILVYRFGKELQGNPVLLLTHYDTVHQKGVLKEFPFSNSDGIIRGPGVFDMKTGLVQGIWALKYLLESNRLTVPVIMMSTPDEEVGSNGSRNAIENIARDCRYTIVLEASANGMIKTGRKGTGRFNVRVLGKAAHAGLEPEKGINAIEEMSRIVIRLQELNKNEKGTTVNVGTIKGGTTSNVVPAEAEISVDIRVWSQEEADRISSFFRSLEPSNMDARVVAEGEFDRPPMTATAKTMELVEKIKGLASGLGLGLKDTSVGGASDGNLVAPLGVPVIDGFGAVGEGAHSRSELVYIDTIPQRSALLALTLMNL